MFFYPAYTFSQIHVLYQEVLSYLSGPNALVAPTKTFEAKTHLADAFAHSQQPGKKERTILLFLIIFNLVSQVYESNKIITQCRNLTRTDNIL